ncbi:MAG: hypothetical protein L6V93_13995 [Clostridiales bacterium]|nr:MAG: hypothetical protein L6V93_13995 [Clostridiales bacterium]
MVQLVVVRTRLQFTSDGTAGGKKDIGYKPVLIESFENGYTFKNGNVINNNLTDENGKSVEKFKSVSFDYEKNGDIVIFAQDKFNSEAELQGNVAETVNGVDIYYYSFANKTVPGDYKLTDADKKSRGKRRACVQLWFARG